MKFRPATFWLGFCLAGCLAGCAADEGQRNGASDVATSIGAASAVAPAPTIGHPTPPVAQAPSMPAQGGITTPYAVAPGYDDGSETEGDNGGVVDPWATMEEQQRRQEVDNAKRGVIDAQDDLNRAVRRLGDNNWDSDLPSVQRRLRDLEDANDSLSSVDPQAASDMDFEISRMKRETRRLEDEDWRDVVPDLEHQNRALSEEADDLENSINQ